MRISKRRQAALAVLLSVSAGVTCADYVAGPSSDYAKLNLAPSFSAAAAKIYRSLETFGLGLDNVQIRLRADVEGPVVKDTVILITGDEEELRVEMQVPMTESERSMRAYIDLRDGDQVLFSATQDVLLRRGVAAARPEPVELDYIGPGADAVSLDVTPATATILATDSVNYTAIATNAAQQTVPVTAIAWSVQDAARGTIDSTGVFRPTNSRGQTYVIGRLPTGLRDSASISVLPTVENVALISGGGQSGTVGTTLEIPIVVETRGADNLPVPGFPIRFLAFTGGGSLSTTTTTSDASARASTILTLGTTSGPNTVLAMSGTDTLVVTATGTPDVPVRLAMVQQPSATAISGTPLATQPSVRLQDTHGNSVSSQGVVIQAAPSAGIQLGGTTTATTNAGGVATFTNLALNGPAGPATLTFSSGNLAPVTSSNIALSLPAPGQLVIVSGADQGALPGGGPLPNPVVVRALDAGGAPRVGATVTFTVISGGGILNGDFSTVDVPTNANGEASVSWRLGASGSQEIRASSGGATADIHGYIAERLVVTQQPSLDPQSGVTLVQQPVIRFQDNGGTNVAIANARIVAQLSLVGGGQPTGHLSGTMFVDTDANGVATFTNLAVHGPGSEPMQLRFYHQIGDAENTQVAAGLSNQLGVRGGPLFQIVPVGTGRTRIFGPVNGTVSFRTMDAEGFNGVAGVPVLLSLANENACVLQNANVTSDANGVVTAEVHSTTNFVSCIIIFEAQQDVPLPGGGTFRPTNFGVVYTADPEIPMWIGGAAPDARSWNIGANWYDGGVPTSDPIIYIPGFPQLFGQATPRLDNNTTVQTLLVENVGSLDLANQTLTVMGDLIGGGNLINGGVVVLGSAGGARANAIVQTGVVRVGETTTGCQRGEPAYSVNNYLIVNTLEMNCQLSVGDGALMQVLGDMRVASSNGAFVAEDGSGTIVTGNALFDNGVSRVDNGNLTVQGTLTVAQGATLDQNNGVLTVAGNATFTGLARLTGGLLDLSGNLTLNGSGTGNAFIASYPHQVNLRGTATTQTVLWDTPAPSRFGQVIVATPATTTYEFTNSAGAPASIDIHDLLISSGRVSLPSFITLSTGAAAGGSLPPGLGVHISSGGSLLNNGNVTVIGPTNPVGCSPLARATTITGPFSCVSQ